MAVNVMEQLWTTATTDTLSTELYTNLVDRYYLNFTSKHYFGEQLKPAQLWFLTYTKNEEQLTALTSELSLVRLPVFQDAKLFPPALTPTSMVSLVNNTLKDFTRTDSEPASNIIRATRKFLTHPTFPEGERQKIVETLYGMVTSFENDYVVAEFFAKLCWLKLIPEEMIEGLKETHFPTFPETNPYQSEEYFSTLIHKNDPELLIPEIMSNPALPPHLVETAVSTFCGDMAMYEATLENEYLPVGVMDKVCSELLREGESWHAIFFAANTPNISYEMFEKIADTIIQDLKESDPSSTFLAYVNTLLECSKLDEKLFNEILPMYVKHISGADSYLGAAPLVQRILTYYPETREMPWEWVETMFL